MIAGRSAGWACGWMHRAARSRVGCIAIPIAPVERMAQSEGFPLTGREVVLTRAAVRGTGAGLRVGDVVLISGEVFTGRDAVHAHLMKNAPPVDMRGSILYHCGPVMLKQGDEWVVKAAGPTTSSREEPYQADDHREVRRAGGDRQRRHGKEDAGGA